MNLAFTAVVVTALFAPIHEETVVWMRGFPMAIPHTGVAVINARARPTPGFVLTSARVEYWQDGTVVHSQSVTIGRDGRLGPTIIKGLASGKAYNVMVIVVENGPGQQRMLANISRVTAR